MHNIELKEFTLLIERVDLKLGSETTFEEIKAFYEEFSNYTLDQLSIAFAWYVKNEMRKPNVPRINNAIKMTAIELLGSPEKIVKEILTVAKNEMNYGTPAKTLRERYGDLHYEVFISWKERIRNGKIEYLENAMIRELKEHFRNELSKSGNVFVTLEIPDEAITEKKQSLLEKKKEVRLLINELQ